IPVAAGLAAGWLAPPLAGGAVEAFLFKLPARSVGAVAPVGGVVVGSGGAGRRAVPVHSPGRQRRDVAAAGRDGRRHRRRRDGRPRSSRARGRSGGRAPVRVASRSARRTGGAVVSRRASTAPPPGRRRARTAVASGPRADRS